MKREIITTQDGSKTIHFPEINESYHSVHGAVQEANHVFLESGLHQFQQEEIHILEIGLGTGLNAILTLAESQKTNQVIQYTGLEAFPISEEEFQALNYSSFPEIKDFTEEYKQIHSCEWEKIVSISPTFSILKNQIEIHRFEPKENSFDLIYFDAFGPRVQPEMWTEEIFQKMYKALRKGGVLVTYSSKGDVRRAMLSAGFEVEKIPGPPGKREMLRARK